MIWILGLCSTWAADRLDVDSLCGDLHIVGGAETVTLDGVPVQGAVRRSHNDCSSAKLAVPSDLRLDITTVSASVIVEDVTGTLDFSSASGSLSVRGSKRPTQVDASTVSGSLTILAAKGGDVELESVSGSAAVSGGPAQRVEVETVSAAITLTMALEPSARVEAHSHSGPLNLRLSRAPALLETSSFSGSVRNPFGSERSEKGAHIELETFSSTIHIERGD